MSPPPRRLSFAVGTSLLSASLSLGVAGCDDKEPTVNPAPEKHGEDHVNVGPDAQPEPKPEPEPIHVNEGPQPQPEQPPEPTESVNVQPEPEPEPKRVNTRPD